MLKKTVVLIALSTGIVLSMTYAQHGVQWLVTAHDWVSEVLTSVFSGGKAGNIARGLIALLSIPILIGLIPTLVYWAFRRHWFPYFMDIVWIVWLVQAGALIVLYKAAAV